MDVKKIVIISIAILTVIIGSNILTGRIQSNRSTKAYNELEDRYRIIEIANNKLRAENLVLINNNKSIREIQQRDAETIQRGRDIIVEFQIGIADSFDTINRIEKGLDSLELLIGILSEEAE